MAEPTHELNFQNLKNKVNQFRIVLSNTKTYREIWKESLKDLIISNLKEICDDIQIKYKVIYEENYHNLGSVILTLGNVKSGIYQSADDNIKKHLLKHNGSLIYQQLFNGKIIVLMNYPSIEGYMESKQPKTIAIYRPEEVKPSYILRHIETLFSELIAWEDFDDDETDRKVAIGFHNNYNLEFNVEQEKTEEAPNIIDKS